MILVRRAVSRKDNRRFVDWFEVRSMAQARELAAEFRANERGIYKTVRADIYKASPVADLTD